MFFFLTILINRGEIVKVWRNWGVRSVCWRAIWCFRLVLHQVRIKTMWTRFSLAFYIVLRPQGIGKQMKTLRKRHHVHIASAIRNCHWENWKFVQKIGVREGRERHIYGIVNSAWVQYLYHFPFCNGNIIMANIAQNILSKQEVNQKSPGHINGKYVTIIAEDSR